MFSIRYNFIFRLITLFIVAKICTCMCMPQTYLINPLIKLFLIADQVTKQLCALYRIWQFTWLFNKTRSLVHIMIQLNPVLTLTPYSFRIHFNIIIHVLHDLSCHLYHLGPLTALLYTFSVSLCLCDYPIYLIARYFFNLIVFLSKTSNRYLRFVFV